MAVAREVKRLRNPEHPAKSPETPGPPPAGVRLDVRGETTRVAVGSPPAGWRGGALWRTPPFSWLARFDEQGAVCLNEERIWVERPQQIGLRWIEAARTVFAGGPEGAAESLPLESMPRRVVRQVRVEKDGESGARLVIEAEAARIELAGANVDRVTLEWVRDYLRDRLAGDA